MHNKSVLIIDDEQGIRSLVSGILSDEGYTCIEAATVNEAHERLAQDKVDLAIVDIWLDNSDEDGIHILKHIKDNTPHMPVIMMSGHGTVKTAVSTIKKGAHDFIEKPFKSDRLLIMVQRALEISALVDENRTLKSTNKEQVAKVIEAQEYFERPKQDYQLVLNNENLLDYSLKDARDLFEHYYLSMQVEKFEGNVSKTAHEVGMERSALHRKIKSLEDRAASIYAEHAPNHQKESQS